MRSQMTERMFHYQQCAGLAIQDAQKLTLPERRAPQRLRQWDTLVDPRGPLAWEPDLRDEQVPANQINSAYAWEERGSQYSRSSTLD